MSQFADLTQLQDCNIKTFPQGVTVGGICYKYTQSEPINIFDMSLGLQSGLMVYESHENGQLLVSRWKLNEQGQCSVQWKFIQGTIQHNLVESDHVGLDVDVVILNFNKNQPISGKVDTGADLCALHATDISQNGNNVTFTFNGSQYTTRVADTVTVSRAGDDQQRIVVSLSFIINDKKIPNIQCTLTDRTGLDSHLLIGKNLLIPSGITIDPSLNETKCTVKIDYNSLDEQFNHETS